MSNKDKKDAEKVQKKITELTPEQIELIDVVREEWLNRFFHDNLAVNHTMDQEKVIEAVEWVYKLAKYDAPRVEFADSPLHAQRLANKAMGTTKTFYPFSLYFNAWDFQWVAFYDFFQRIGVVDNENFTKYKEFSKLGVYDTIQFDELCIVVKMPDSISTDDQDRLHCEDGPAIRWSDFDPELDLAYYWHGVNVTRQMIMDPNSITREQFMAEKNVEIKRCMQEILGPEGFFRLMELEELDRDVDGQGNIQVLMRSVEPDPDVLVDEESDGHLYFVKVICPSSDREYHISVPKSKNVWEAVSWTFSKDEGEYKPIIET